MSDRIIRTGENKGKFLVIDHQKKLVRIVSVLNEVKVESEYLRNRSSELDCSIQDLLHYIEFADLDVKRGYKAYKKLQELRIERRLVKVECEQCEIALESLKAMELIIPTLTKAIGKIEKMKQNSKQYYVRSKKDMIFDDFEEQQVKYDKKMAENVYIR